MTVLEKPDLELAWADPTLSASLYTRHLDQAIAEVVRPFWLQVREESGESGASLWFLRYAKGDEHLKLRLHGPEDCRDRWAALLAEHAEPWLRSQGGIELRRASQGRSLQPIDLEEATLADADDGEPGSRLVRTTYVRRDFVMGDSRLLADDRYATLFTRAVARGCELLLDEWQASDSGDFRRIRQRLFFDRIGAALAVLWPSEHDRDRYIAYHRDGVVRFAVLRSSLGTKKAKGILKLYRRERERAGERLPLPAVQATGDGSLSALQESWWDSLIRLRAYMEEVGGALGGATDPFAPDAFFPALFRVLHNVVNALGFNPITEGLLFHLLRPADEAPKPSRDAESADDAGDAEDLDDVLLVPEARTLPPIREVFDFREEIDLFDFNLSYDWWGLITDGSEAGREWGMLYRRLASPIWPLVKESMQLLRQRRVAEGESRLVEMARRMVDLEAEDRAVHSIVRRFYLGARAYAEYARRDFEAAEQTMSEVIPTLEAAIAANPVVLPITAQAADVPLKGIKLARALYDWPQVTEWARQLLAMVEDEQPLCRYPDGSGIFHATIGEFLTPAISEQSRHGEAVRYMLEPKRRLVWLRRQLEATYATAGAFVWYTQTDSSQL